MSVKEFAQHGISRMVVGRAVEQLVQFQSGDWICARSSEINLRMDDP